MLTEAGQANADAPTGDSHSPAVAPPAAEPAATASDPAAETPRNFLANLRLAGSGFSSFLVHALLLCLLAFLPSPDAGLRAIKEIKSWMIEDLDEPIPTETPVVNLNEISDAPLDELISSQALAVAPIRALDAQLDSVVETIETDQPDLEVRP